ncbi:MAG: ISAs1 family transposase [Clostridia bacterium]|nr:ISAs1 family transposase [Clostridia bacterium]
MNGTLMEIFRDIPDPRSGNGIRHRLDEVLVIAILAIICDFSKFTEMELFGQEHEEWLRTFLSLENGIPSHDTFGDVFAALSPKAIQSRFIEWVETIREKINGDIVSIDGKTIRRSKDIANNKRAIHVVSAWSAANGIVLGELATEEKSNEITAIPELLKMLELKGCIVTIDAIGTQVEIAKTIINSGADYVLAVKENQSELLQDIRLFYSSESALCDYAETNEKSHGRYEKRESWISTDIDWLYNKDKWAGITGIGMIRSKRQQVGSDVVENSVRYFIFSKDMTAMELLTANRAHWGIENSLHWVLDMDFREDESRMRLGNCATNINVFRHLALNLIKNETSTKLSVNMKRKRCMISLDYLLKVIGVS